MLVYQQLRSRIEDAMEARSEARKVLDSLYLTDEQKLASSVYAEAHAKYALALDAYSRCFPKGA